MIDQRYRDKFWAFVTVFGTLWGGLELTLGTFLHVLHVPKTGFIMVSLSLILLIAQRRIFPARGSTICAGIIAACIKSLSPGGIIAGPIFGILSEAIIVELFLLAGSRSLIPCLCAGTFAILWSQIQSLFKMWVYYGQDFFTALAKILEKFFKIQWTATVGWSLLAIFGAIILAVGCLVGFFGWRLGARTESAIKSLQPSADFDDIQSDELYKKDDIHTSEMQMNTECNTSSSDDLNETADNNICQNSQNSGKITACETRRKRPNIDNEPIIKTRLWMLPAALAALMIQFTGDPLWSGISLGIWLIALWIAARGVIRAIWWPKFWAITIVVSALCGVLIAWNIDGIWQWMLGIEAAARMLIRGTFVFSLISWATRCIRPQEFLTIWDKVHLPELGLALTRAYALLPAWSDRLHEIVQNRPAGLRGTWQYIHQSILKCLIDATIQTQKIH